MSKITITKPAMDCGSSAAMPRMIGVSLPAPPFEIPRTDRSETAPSKRVIRSNQDWRKMDRMLRHAERIGL